MECSRGSLNQIPPWAQCSGDIRLTPFYDVAEVKAAVLSWVAELNANIE
jgi:acetylornithine deacetylase